MTGWNGINLTKIVPKETVPKAGEISVHSQHQVVTTVWVESIVWHFIQPINLLFGLELPVAEFGKQMTWVTLGPPLRIKILYLG